MCEFVSWIEKDGEVIYLTGKDVFHIKAGKKLQKYCGNAADLVGHGAIRKFYNFEGGYEKECSDFSSPKNFPKEIVNAIKKGEMRGLATPIKLLTKSGQNKYHKLTTMIDFDFFPKSIATKLKRIVKNKEAGYDGNNTHGGSYPFCYFTWSRTKEGQNFWEKIDAICGNGYESRFQNIFWDLFKQNKYRRASWRDRKIRKKSA